MNRKNAFTLIELLAVIIILGILMIIAIPSVTTYISNSRKSAYIDTAKEIINGARNFVNEGKLEMFDTNSTYYLPTNCIKTENSSKSPYGEFTKAYVGVIYDGKGYKYYWISVDSAGQGVKYITPLDKLDIEDIESDIKDTDIEDIVTTTGIGKRSEIKILNCSTNNWEREYHLDETSNNASEENGGGTPPVPTAASLILATAKEEGQLYQIPDTNIYIFNGSSPSNFLRFNNEIWRIIGIYGNQLKIIKGSVHTQRDQYGSDSEEWEDSYILRYLENIYYEDYLNDNAKEMIDENAEWYVAGIYGEPYASSAFNYAKTRTWNGKIGLLNVYEYLYGASSECFNESGFNFGYSRCSRKDWLFRTITVSGYSNAMLINRAYYSNYNYVFVVYCDDGSMNRNNTYNNFYENPVVYLKPSVMLTGGTGTSSDPYTLSM